MAPVSNPDKDVDGPDGGECLFSVASELSLIKWLKAEKLANMLASLQQGDTLGPLILHVC